VSALDQWITGAVQPAALRWFRQPVVEIKQISAYSCRGMNGNPNAHISEHAFGNALDVAEFDLADGHKVSVQSGWQGSPEEQGFLHDVQSAACDHFTTVLAPGANVYHYNHIHVDLMRHYNDRHICEPSAIPGEVAAARVRSRFAAQHPGEHYGDPNITGSIKEKPHRRPLGYSGEDDDRLPEAVPGDD
jgi:Extensin-like protein C-terminus